jgi:predicted transcriptional regulator
LIGALALKLLEIIEKITQKIAPGPSPSFNEAHIVKVLEIINDEKNVGRIKLSKELGLGEGATRTLLKRLKNEGLTQSSRSGISFTEKGKKLFTELQNKLSKGIDVPKSELTVGTCNIAVLVRDSANSIGSGMEQRDTAIMCGASGATTLVFSNDKLTLPHGEENISETMPDLHDKLISQLEPKENDVIIVGCGKNKDLAEIGAKMAAIKLLKSNN